MSVNVPRRFKLLAELNYGQKSLEDGRFTWGLVRDVDVDFIDWNATIFGPENTYFMGRVYELKITCNMNYPREPPLVQFVNKINLPCVDASGRLKRDFVGITQWASSEQTFQWFFDKIYREMQNNPRLHQPPEGAKY